MKNKAAVPPLPKEERHDDTFVFFTFFPFLTLSFLRFSLIPGARVFSEPHSILSTPPFFSMVPYHSSFLPK